MAPAEPGRRRDPVRRTRPGAGWTCPAPASASTSTRSPTTGAPLALAGLAWPGERGLAGHSDGDVAAHAACDALFAAAGLGDLGTHFGTDRPELAGAAGVRLLAEAAAHPGRGRVPHRQRLGAGDRQPAASSGPRREEAQAALSAAAGAPVSVAATTTDGLGLTGRGEGVAAIATALVLRRV